MFIETKKIIYSCVCNNFKESPMLIIDEETNLKAGNTVFIKYKNEILDAVVLNSGHGEGTPFDDEF